MITLDLLTDRRIGHGFLTREGGVSQGLYASLNCGFGSGDERAAVAENRARAAARLGVEPDRLVTVHQVHSPTVAIVTAPWTPDVAPRADAMVTTEPGIALAILAADCAPVLLADVTAGVIGAAHAGWKGAKAGVIDATIDAMVSLGAEPERIAAAVGPRIQQASYEVGPEFPTPFLDEDPAHAELFRPSSRPGHHLFDLGGYIARRLAQKGVPHWALSAQDTLSDEARFFSYRRTCLRGEGDYGRGLSAIVLRG